MSDVSPTPPNIAPASLDLPTARIAPPRKRPSAIWLVPLIAIIVSVFVLFQAWRQRGVAIEIRFERSEGLRVGDAIRLRGVDIGRVDRVALATDGDAVTVHARLHREATTCAQAGARFWIARPKVGLHGVSGLETVIGPRYIVAEPGDGAVLLQHAGLHEAPSPITIPPGSLSLELRSSVVGGLREGAPVTYRQFSVGQVYAVSLTPDANSITIRIAIDAPYRDLVRANSVFWNASGIDLAGGLFKGLSVEIDSLQSLLAGGVAFATPDHPGSQVSAEHRFVLATEQPDRWRTWQPSIAFGSSLLPANAIPVWPQRARMSGESGRLWTRLHTQEAWAVPTPEGWLVPQDLLRIPEQVRPESLHLTIDGESQPIPEQTSATHVARIPAALQQAVSVMRSMQRGENCIMYGDPQRGAWPLEGTRIGERGLIHPPEPARWHGALVRAQSDGAWVGMVIVDGEQAHIVDLPN